MFSGELERDHTAWKMSKYGVISGPYFLVFGLNAGKYWPENYSVFGHFSCSASCMIWVICNIFLLANKIVSKSSI